MTRILMSATLSKQLQKRNNKRSRQQQTIETIQKTTMPRNAAARVLNGNAALE